MLERHIWSRVALLGRYWSGIQSGLVSAGIHRKDSKWRGWRGSDAEQSAAEGREPNLRWVGRRREEDDWVGMQQRTEMEKKEERRGGERVGSEKQGKNRDEGEMGGCCTEPMVDRMQKKSHKSLRNAAGNTWCHCIDHFSQLSQKS